MPANTHAPAPAHARVVEMTEQERDEDARILREVIDGAKRTRFPWVQIDVARATRLLTLVTASRAEWVEGEGGEVRADDIAWLREQGEKHARAVEYWQSSVERDEDPSFAESRAAECQQNAARYSRIASALTHPRAGAAEGRVEGEEANKTWRELRSQVDALFPEFPDALDSSRRTNLLNAVQSHVIAVRAQFGYVPSPAQVERAARGIYEVNFTPALEWNRVDESLKDRYRIEARAALTAALCPPSAPPPREAEGC
jgi:hypothetical protein